MVREALPYPTVYFMVILALLAPFVPVSGCRAAS